SPADVAGLMEGDTLIFVDGVSVSTLTLNALRDKLGGQIGDTKVLLIRRGSGEVQITVTIAEYFVPSVFQDSLDTDVAYIQLTTFLTETGVSGGSSQEFRTALEQTSWATYTIFDLRFNGGGLLSQAVDIASEFLESQTPLINIKERVLNEGRNTGRIEQRVLISGEAGSAKERNFMVLINNFTASASELLVSALRSNRSDIKTVGETTFGKARAQILSETPESGLVKVTKMTIEPIVGVSYDLEGIAPDIPIAPGEDALEVALQQVKGTLLSKSSAQTRALRRIRALHRMQEDRSFKPLNITYDRLPSSL
ncbi:MAG: S41 family peptidase, partial [Nitrosomonadaceae bacterium]